MAGPDRTPPHDPTAERAVLGSLLIDYVRSWPLVVATGLKASDFFGRAHEAIYRRLSLWAWSNRQPDVITLMAAIAKDLRWDPQQVEDFLGELIDSTPTAANADFYAGRVRTYSVRRKLIETAILTVNRAYEEDGESSVHQEIGFALDDLTKLQEEGIGRRDLATYDGNQLLADPPPARNLVVGHGILALEEWILIIGEEKAGKSILALDLATALVMEEEREATWCEFNVFGPRRVLYLVGEGGRRSMYARWKKRSEELTPAERARFFTWYPDPYLMEIENPEELARLERFLVEHAIEVLFFDPLAHFHGSEENEAGPMKKIGGRFIALCQKLGIAIVVVHHTRKTTITSRKGSPREGRGSTALFGASDGAIVMEYEGEQSDPERRLTFTFRHAEEYVDPRVVELNRRTLCYQVNPRNPGGRPQQQGVDMEQFLGWLRERGEPATAKEAADATNIPVRTIQDWCRILVQENELARTREASNHPYRYGLTTWVEPPPQQGSLLGDAEK